jgi:hypothetical protein
VEVDALYFEQAVAQKAVLCASQVLDRAAGAVARGAARCASHLLDRGAYAGAQAAASTRQMSR